MQSVVTTSSDETRSRSPARRSGIFAGRSASAVLNGPGLRVIGTVLISSE